MNDFGVSKIKEYLIQHNDCFVIIGGIAVYLNLDERGLPARETQDLDIVVLADGTDNEFNKAIIKLIKDGGYERAICHDKSIYYRFIKPKHPSFPKIIELFAKENDKLCKRLEKIKICDDNNEYLSAIVLNEEIFSFINQHKYLLPSGLPVVDVLGLIALKIYAYYENKKLYEQGLVVGTDKFEKHRRDVIRLLLSLKPEENQITLTEQIKEYCNAFKNVINESTQAIYDISDHAIDPIKVIEIYKSIFN